MNTRYHAIAGFLILLIGLLAIDPETKVIIVQKGKEREVIIL